MLLVRLSAITAALMWERVVGGLVNTKLYGESIGDSVRRVLNTHTDYYPHSMYGDRPSARYPILPASSGIPLGRIAERLEEETKAEIEPDIKEPDEVVDVIEDEDERSSSIFSDEDEPDDLQVAMNLRGRAPEAAPTTSSSRKPISHPIHLFYSTDSDNEIDEIDAASTVVDDASPQDTFSEIVGITPYSPFSTQSRQTVIRDGLFEYGLSNPAPIHRPAFNVPDDGKKIVVWDLDETLVELNSQSSWPWNILPYPDDVLIYRRQNYYILR